MELFVIQEQIPDTYLGNLESRAPRRANIPIFSFFCTSVFILKITGSLTCLVGLCVGGASTHTLVYVFKVFFPKCAVNNEIPC